LFFAEIIIKDKKGSDEATKENRQSRFLIFCSTLDSKLANYFCHLVGQSPWTGD
jgi:hypothetical protein